jgi:hypothetical protein
MFIFGVPNLVLFPDDFINPDEKDEKWHRQYVQAGYYAMYNNAYYNGKYNQWILNELYAQGKQPIERYIKALCQNAEENYMDINWRQVSILPKVRDIVIGYLSKVDFSVQCAAINPDAVAKKEQLKWDMWAEKEMLSEAKKFMDMMGVTNMPLEAQQDLSWVPDELPEYELLANLYLKLKEEIQAEVGTEAVLSENEWDVVRRIMLENFFDNGMACIEKRINNYSQAIEVKSYNMTNVILPNYTGKTGEKVWIAGVCEPMSVYDVYREAGDQFTPDQYKEIAKRYDQTLGNPQFQQYNSLYGNNYSSWKGYNVYRVRMYWFSTDVVRYKKVTKNGAETYYKSGYEKAKGREEKITKDGRKIIVESGDMYKQTVHECSWIIGTDYVYNYGKVNSFSRDQLNKRECMLPLSIYKVSEQGRTERAIPFIDAISISWYKLQDRKARAIPSGITVDLSAIEKLVVDNKEMTVKQILNLAVQTGLFLYRSEDSMIPEGGGKPIESRESGWGIEAEQYMKDIQNNIQLVNAVIGVNEFMDATTPMASTAATVAKLSTESALNGFSDIIDGMIWLHEKTVIDIAGKLQRATMYGLQKLYNQKIGKWIEFENDFSLTQLGIKVVRQPLQQEKEFLLNYLIDVTKEPSSPLDPDDFFFLKNIIETSQSIKFTQQYVTMVVNKRRRQKAADAERIGVAQAEAQAQAKQQELMLADEMANKSMEREMALYTHKTNEDIRKMQATGASKIEQSAVKSELKKDEKATEAQVKAIYGG